MNERLEYIESLSLIKEAETLISESRELLKEIKYNIDDSDSRAETEALREAVLQLRLRNDSLYMENILLRSKIRELTGAPVLNLAEPSIKSYFKKPKK
jgi:hypothetical protein